MRGYVQKLRNELKRERPNAGLAGEYARGAASRALEAYPSLREKKIVRRPIEVRPGWKYLNDGPTEPLAQDAKVMAYASGVLDVVLCQAWLNSQEGQ